MIPTEQTVCTLEQSKLLVEKYDIVLDTQWYWIKNQYNINFFIVDKETVLCTAWDKCYPAPSCAELGVLLPPFFKEIDGAIDDNWTETWWTHNEKDEEYFYCYFTNKESTEVIFSAKADVRSPGQMWGSNLATRKRIY